MARVPIGLGLDVDFLLLHGLVQVVEGVDIPFGEKGHVDGFSQGHAEVRIARIGGRARQYLEGCLEIGTAAAERGDRCKDLVHVLAVFGGVLGGFGRLAEVFLEARLDQAVVAQGNGDAADRDGLGGRVEQGDFLAEG